MAFEVGKTYTFSENEFEKSRESGKLVFKVRDPASATPYIVKPFEFQTTDIPEKIVCIYKGNDRLEQDQNAVVPELYEIGKTYRFRVMRQDNNVGAHVSIRDDARGLTFYPIDLGREKFERFQRITCEVISTEKGQLKLKYLKEHESAPAKFSLSDLQNLKGARLMANPKFVKKFLANPIFDEARSRYVDGNPEWILTAIEAVTQNVAMWFVTKTGFRQNLLQQVKELALSLIERSEYLNIFPMEERRSLQGRLSETILTCEDYLMSSSLIIQGIDVEYITETLASLRSSGWLYKPEAKMRMMMALFTLRNSYAHDYIWEIFKIISDHHADQRFIGEFADGFILMLQIFIDNEGKFVNTTSHDALREIIEAIAILLLLTQNKEYARWNYYRGRLYTLAMLLVGRHEPALVEKAFKALTENLEMPLEYTWKDLEDVNRLCHVYLCSMVNYRKESRKSVSTYEGQNTVLSVSDGKIKISPVATGSNTKEVLEFPLSEDIFFSVCLNGRLDSKTTPDDMNIPRHHVMWKELETSLFDPIQHVTDPLAQKAAEKKKKMVPGIGDEISFRITGRDDSDLYTFRCVIEDSVYEGRGIINSRNIVPYPVTPSPENFILDGDDMLFYGRIIETLPNGEFRFSMEREVDELMMNIAQEDFSEENQMKAVITKENKETVLAVTDGGYPVLIPKKGVDLKQHQRVWISITDVSTNKKTGRPYLAAQFCEFDEDSNTADNYNFVKNGFKYLLDNVNGGKKWIPEPKPVEPEKPEVEEVVESLPDTYLSPDAVYGMSRLLNAMANVTNDNITEVYTLLAAGRLLALLTGDTYRAQYMELKQSLVEGLSRFMIDDRVDNAAVVELTRRVNQFPGNDADLLRRLEVLQVLATLDLPATDCSLALPDESDSPLTGSLKRMVASYNLMRGLRLNNLRQELKRSIYDLLNLQMPNIDVSRVNATEDQHHEFKESMIYPAGNNMKPDQKKQELELAQVICGMLNTEGGVLYIGVANSGVPRGLDSDFVYINNGFEEYDLEDVKDKFCLLFCRSLRVNFGLTIDGVQLYPTLVTLEYDDIDGHCFAVVTVKPYRGAVKLTDGTMFIRQGSSTLPVKKKADQIALDKARRVAQK
jgi:hypothetical protein